MPILQCWCRLALVVKPSLSKCTFYPEVINCPCCWYVQPIKLNELALFRWIEIECFCAYCSTLKCSVCDNLNKLCKAAPEKVKENCQIKKQYSLSTDCMAQMRMKMRVERGKAEETESAPPVCRSNINAVQSQIYWRMHYIGKIIQMHNKYKTDAKQIQHKCNCKAKET